MNGRRHATTRPMKTPFSPTSRDIACEADCSPQAWALVTVAAAAGGQPAPCTGQGQPEQPPQVRAEPPRPAQQQEQQIRERFDASGWN